MDSRASEKRCVSCPSSSGGNSLQKDSKHIIHISRYLQEDSSGISHRSRRPAPGFWSCEQTGGFFDCTGVLAHLPSHAQASINTSVSIRYCTVLLFDERKSEIKLSSSFSHAKWSACKSCRCSLSCAPKSCHPNGTQLCTSDIAKRITLLPSVGTGPRSCQRKVPK